MEHNQIEQLLNENESAYLDFKRDQYHFEGVDDNEKSELLKDILSFANAWRRTDAFILIGVEEVKGGRNKVIGVNSHLDDHSLQQFVNKKTQKPVDFEYKALVFEGLHLGILRIRLQDRPIFLTKNYGRLKKNIVYIRRGSSTDEASPDEIAKMGITSFEALDETSLDLQFADIPSREPLGRSQKILCKILKLPKGQSIPKHEPRSQFPYIEFSQPNKKFYEELFQYYFDLFLLTPVGFTITNNGQVTANNVRLLITEKQDPRLKIFTESELTNRPEKYYSYFHSSIVKSINSSPTYVKGDIDIAYHSTKWTLEVELGNIQPKAQVWSNDEFYIGMQEDATKEFHATLYADNLPNPIVVPLHLEFECESVIVNIEDLEQRLEEEVSQELKEISDDFD
jgi:hypothetical protein